MLSAMDASWSEFCSELLPAGLPFSTSILPNARSRLRRYANLSLTFTHAWAILPSFPVTDSMVPSSAPTTAPRLLSIATKTPTDVCLRSSSPAASSVIPAALDANLHPSLASLLNCSFSLSFLYLCSIPKKISNVPLYPFACTFFLCCTLIHSARCTLTSSLLFSFQTSQLLLTASTFSEAFSSAPPEGFCHPGPLWCL